MCVCSPRRGREREGGGAVSDARSETLAQPPVRIICCHAPCDMSGATTWSALLTAAPRRRCLCRQRKSAVLRACSSAESGAAVQLHRRAVSLLLGGLCSVALAEPSLSATTSPYNETAAEVGLVQGHLRNCPSTFNCVSTAAKSSDQYAGPWSAANETSPSAAAELIITAVQAIEPRAVLVTSEAVAPDGHYVRLQLPGAFDLTDELEFYLLREQSALRADNGNVLVTFRSCAGGVKCVCPCEHPLCTMHMTDLRACQTSTPS